MRTHNYIFASIFGALGLAALITLFFGATHQLFTAVLCMAMVAVLLYENKKNLAE